MVEIARALSTNARIIVMDEPTTSLTSRETEKLFEVIATLKAHGIAIIYISHRMEEVYQIADRVTVLRDAGYVGTLDRSELSASRLVSMMVGRDLSGFYKKDHSPSAQGEKAVALSVRNLSGGALVRDCSFDLHRGEVLGLSGLVGSGRTEAARIIYGADPREGGEILIDGKPVEIGSPSDAMAMGLVYLTEDRKSLGLFLDMSISDNINMAVMPEDAYGGIVRNLSSAARRADAAFSALSIRAKSPLVTLGALSGGNQQKVLLARLLELQAEHHPSGRADPRRGRRSEVRDLPADRRTRQTRYRNSVDFKRPSRDRRRLRQDAGHARRRRRRRSGTEGRRPDPSGRRDRTCHWSTRTLTQEDTAKAPASQSGSRSRLNPRELMSTLGMLPALVLIALVFWGINPRFMTNTNLTIVLQQSAINIVLGAGMTFVILTGGIDLSVGSILAASAMVAVLASLWPDFGMLGIPAAMALGLGFGLVNGLLVAYVRLPPFIVTLGTLTAIRGVARLIGQDTTVFNADLPFAEIGNGSIFGVPWLVVIALVVVVISWLILRRTVLGTWIYAIGGNAEAARLTGIKVPFVLLFVYGMSGFLAGLGGAMSAARLLAANGLQLGQSYELDAIAAVILGGTSFVGGIGSIWGTLIGGLIIAVLSNGLILAGVSDVWQYIIKGLVIVIAVALDRFRLREGART